MARIKLNLGCGNNALPGYVNVDKYGTPEVRHDLETFPWPWETGSVDEIVLRHVLEHLGQSTDVFLRIVQEIYRVCADGAVVRIAVPHPRSDEFLGDPTHVRPVTPEMLSLFSKKNNERWAAEGSSHSPLALYLGVDLEIGEVDFLLHEPWSSQRAAGRISDEDLNIAATRYNNVIAEVHMTLKVVKPAF